MLWKIYVFFKFVIFHFFLMIQEIENLTNFLCSYVLGSNLQSFKNAKKLFIFQEMKLFNLKLKNSSFLGENFRLFHHCFFRRFHSFFFHAFISSRSHFFRCFHCWLHLFALLFLYCFSSTPFLCCCTASATDLRGRFLLSGVFYLILLPAFIKTFLGPAVLPWRLQGLPLRLKTQTRSIN